MRFQIYNERFASISHINVVHTIKKAHKLPNIIPLQSSTTDTILYNLLLHNFAFEPKKNIKIKHKKYNTKNIQPPKLVKTLPVHQ